MLFEVNSNLLAPFMLLCLTCWSFGAFACFLPVSLHLLKILWKLFFPVVLDVSTLRIVVTRSGLSLILLVEFLDWVSSKFA